MLLYFSHMSGGKYLIGDYDTQRDKLLVTAGGRFNFGSAQPGGVHAPSATPDSDGGLIVIFNMNPAKPTRGWDQVMSLPRRLTWPSTTRSRWSRPATSPRCAAVTSGWGRRNCRRTGT